MPEGCQCSHWGDLTEVLLGSMMPEQAGKNHNPCLIKIKGKKITIMDENTHTHKHTKQKHRSALLCVTHDPPLSRRLLMVGRGREQDSLPARGTNERFPSPFGSLPGSRPLPRHRASPRYLRNFIKYFTIPFTGETTCN